jgi:hypothetical protein
MKLRNHKKPNMKANLFRYIKKLILIESKESSKRAIAVYSVALITYVVVRFTDSNNAVIILTTLCSFVLALVGVASWQAVKKSAEQNSGTINK